MRRTLPITFVLPLVLAACADSWGAAQPEFRSLYSVTAVGRLDGAGEARKLIAESDGVIAAILVSRGRQVKAGEALMEIDCAQRRAELTVSQAEARRANEAARVLLASERRTEIEAAEARIAAAEAGAREARQRLTSARTLVPSGFIARRDLETRENALASMGAELSAARATRMGLADKSRRAQIAEARAAADVAAAQVALAHTMAGKCILRSPIDGQVVQILRREGESSGASQGTALIEVANTKHLRVRAEIGERDAGNVHVGQRAEIWLDGQDGKWTGRVVEAAQAMGRRSARSLDPTDRFDRDIREVFIAFDEGQQRPPALIGLRMTVGLIR